VRIFDKNTLPTDAVLDIIARHPTKCLSEIADETFFKELNDTHFMRIAVLLAQKSYEEGGCPIGGVIIDNKTRKIMGKGHNTLIQENDPYNHGETAAIKNAGRIDFSLTTIFTTLSPCDVCASLVHMRGFDRIVVGDVTNASGNEKLLADKGVKVVILEDQKGIALYAQYRKEKPDQDLEDWMGLAAVRRAHEAKTPHPKR
jgi:cytosine deaminase